MVEQRLAFLVADIISEGIADTCLQMFSCFSSCSFAAPQKVGAVFKIAASAQRKTAPTKVSAVGHGMLI